MVSGVVATAALLLAVAVLNRYPLVTSDTGTYVHSSFTWRVPSDRPVYYGLFLALTHLGRTLWMPIVAQALIVALALRLLLRRLLPEAGPWTAIFTTLVLAVATSLPWFVGALSPDLFAGLCIVSWYLALSDEADPPAARAFAIACLMLSVMVHTSHLLVALLLTATVQIGAWCGRPSAGVRRVWGVLAVAALATVAGNLVLSGTPGLGRGSHAFLMGRLIEDGIIGQVLDERCARQPYRLCAARADLPMSAEEYLWKTDGLLQRTGGFTGSQAESQQLIRAAIVDHPGPVLRGALASTARQLVHFRTGDGLTPMPDGSWVDTVMATRFRAEYPRFRSTRQRDGTLPLNVFGTLHHITAILALLFLAVTAILRRTSASSVDLAFGGYVVLALLANAVVTGALSGVHDRYQSRLMWLVVLAALVAVRRTFGAWRQA